MAIIRKHIRLQDVDLKLAGDGETMTFEGYASKWGGVDSYGDTILRGAFASTLRNNGTPKMFFNHDWGGLPIGKWSKAVEDENGLYVKGEFTPGLSLAGDVRAAMKHGTLDGLSIGGFVKSGDYQTTEAGGRIITKWSTLVEISPVVFPADSAARVDTSSVKGADIIDAINEIESLKDLEALLRDAAGFSKTAATALVSRARHVLSQRGDPGTKSTDGMQELAARLQSLADGLKA